MFLYTRRTASSSEEIFYNLFYLYQEKLIPVCRQSFLFVLSIGRSKLEYAAAAIFNDKLTKERRGGSVSKLGDLRNLVIDHICTFRVQEMHYGKITTFNRVYLPLELTTKKMHSMFINRYSDSQCKYNFYYNIFKQKFNISFETLKVAVLHVNIIKIAWKKVVWTQTQRRL